jgi:hypothetical protein
MKTVLLSLLLALRCYAPTPLFFAQNGASAAAFSPADVSGLTIWLVADDISGSDGDTFETWPAHGSTTISATQSTVASRATIQVSEVNGHRAVLTDGVNDWYDLSSTVSSTASWTVFVVQKRTSSGAYAVFLSNNNSSAMAPYSPVEWGAASQTYLGTRTLQRYWSGIPSVDWHVLTGQDDAGTPYLWTDGTSRTLTPQAGGGAYDFARLFRQGTAYSSQYAAELIFYNRTLTTTERQNVEAYLRSPEKYGTPAP